MASRAAERRKQYDLVEGRKAGIIPPAVDKHGKDINPHIPEYIAKKPWYDLTQEPGLEHQKKQKPEPRKLLSSSFIRGQKTHQADSYRKGACENCGAMTHVSKACMERPREKGAKHTNKYIAPDEKLFESSGELDYDAKRDRWNGYDISRYAQDTKVYEAREEARKKYRKEEQMKKLEETASAAVDEKEDEAKVDESQQVDFGKVEKRVRTTGGGSTGTVRNLRIREDTAKYLYCLDVDSSYYDPKTRSMRENPNPENDPNENFYAGDNKNRETGQALEFKHLNVYAWESSDKGQDVHPQAAPSQAELLYKSFKVSKGMLNAKNKDAIMQKYGSAAAEGDIPKELLLGQSERQVEYDRAGRIIKGIEMAITRSKYEEELYINNHTTVWGSWWKAHQWGYKCCKQMIKNSYCTGAAGIEASEAAADLMKANIARKETSEEPAPAEGNKIKLAPWGTDVPEDQVLDPKRLDEALKKEDGRRREERDERKRKYNVKWNDQVTAEDMEAFRMKKVHHDDPMKDFLHQNKIDSDSVIICKAGN
ncbi:hypothetical protein MKW94_017258 [Papaver nudicaule]|uniref:Pre-mRNA-splicing factor SLU7 n=1 Tax=Papaver nudicaule TaxID=74823 RepID=A0AA41VRV4_PAPNU|nr:hypothetical protein [Papaver nudicaule]